jgi:hypothetical protein
MRPCIFKCIYLHQRLCLYDFYVGMNADVALCRGQSALEHVCFLKISLSESSQSLPPPPPSIPPLHPICSTAMNDPWLKHPKKSAFTDKRIQTICLNPREDKPLMTEDTRPLMAEDNGKASYNALRMPLTETVKASHSARFSEYILV